jgi:hypothetical protein
VKQQLTYYNPKFEVITAVLLSIQGFWDVTLYHQASGSQHSEQSGIPGWMLYHQASGSQHSEGLTSGTTHLMTQPHTPEDLNHQIKNKFHPHSVKSPLFHQSRQTKAVSASKKSIFLEK